MEHPPQRGPKTRRKVLGDATLRANEDTSSLHRRGDKLSLEPVAISSLKPLPHNESLVPNGTLTVRHQPRSSPSPASNFSAVDNNEPRPHKSKRDSEISNASTNASGTGQRRKTHIGPWQLGKTIGRGGCSRVRIVRHSVTGEYGAAKIISKKTAEKVSALSLANLIKSAEENSLMSDGGKVIPFGLEREIVIMKLLDHPNIVRLHDVWENRNELYLIMEYVQGGELFSYIGDQGALDEMEVVHLFRQIIAALLYCHRLNIHHRDLKPENILLDRNTMEIKLVDFGMAALQPVGKKLTTPCGSPHYAAPEVIRSGSYDGGMADVWSCGVILFVMLTGSPPFNYTGDQEDLGHLFSAIARADYKMPTNLSREAQDLIRRILVAKVKNRITIEAIWDHKFLHKYDVELQFYGDTATVQHWVGPMPAITEWTPLELQTIDREILRNLRTLWHSEKLEVLMQRLTSKEANQEKYFYAALKRHRDDTLENYSPNPFAVGYSHSDHHHYTKAAPTAADMLNLPSDKHIRSQSGYSILNDEHLYSKHSFYDPPSDHSYDPFRASREPLIPGRSVFSQNVPVGGASDTGSRNMRPVTALGHRTGSSLRIQALRNSKRQSSGTISRATSKRSTLPSQRNLGARRRSMSKSSLGSSNWPSSPPVVVRASSMAKRGVSFSHLSRASSNSANTLDNGGVRHTPEHRRIPHCRNSASSSTGSPRPSMQTAPRARPVSRVAANPIVPRLRIRRPDSPSKYIQSEARKVSTELEKVMDEAFNRSSISSSIRTTATDNTREMSVFDTPPTSVSNRDSGASRLATPTQKATLNRPLPPIPMKETPNTFIQRKLLETREEIARRLQEDGDGIEHFSQALQHLDLFMQPSVVDGRRTSSAPARSPEHPGALPVISEDAREDRCGFCSATQSRVADPPRPGLQARRAMTEHTTIRTVDQSPTSQPIAPLNVRKKSGTSTISRATHANSTPAEPLADSTPQPLERTFQVAEDDLSAMATKDVVSQDLTALPVPEKEPKIKKKISLWFRRTTEEKEQRPADQPQARTSTLLQIPEAWQGLDDRINKSAPASAVTKLDTTKQLTKPRENSREFPIRNVITVAGMANGGTGRKGFLGFFGKRSKEDKAKRPMQIGSANFSSASILSGLDLDLEETEDTAAVRAPEMQLNWISRFLHIKPANKVLCFQLGRGRVRCELVRLLRRWQRYGVRDITMDRKSNVINARVDKANRLNIKPVSIVIELFAVLEHGQRAQICLARFTQTRGAASSFRRVVEIVEDFCKSSGFLVQDEEKKAAMCEIIG